MSGLPCPNCGSELAFLAQYQRHYCYACGKYAPEGFGDRGAKRCPTCTGILSYVTQYDRYYCYRCSSYPPEGVFMEPQATATSPPSDAPAAASSTALVVLEPAKRQDLAPSASEPAATGPVERTAEEEIQPQDTGSQKQRRALDREEITTAKKPLLMQLCKDYDLESTGTREELRQRLLSYLDQLEGTESSDAAAETTEAAGEAEGTRQEPEAESPEPVISEEQPPESFTSEAQPPESVTSEAQETPQGMAESSDSQIGSQTESAPSLPSVAASTTTLQVRPEAPTPGPAEPSGVAAASREPIAQVAPSYPATKVDHPCPTCGRALTYVQQYGRWYCYSCRTYAPRTMAKFACPNCGAALRWISQYSRWWCDACRRYAPADLPKPEGATAQTTVVPSVATRPAAATTITHRHPSPGSAIGLVSFGLLLFVVYEVLVDLPAVLSVNTGFILAPDVAFGLHFFAFLFVAVGAILGLSAIRARR